MYRRLLFACVVGVAAFAAPDIALGQPLPGPAVSDWLPCNHLVQTSGGGFADAPPAPSAATEPCPCTPAERHPRVTVQAEYLLWWLRGASAPPLVATSPRGVQFPVAGVLGQPTTTVLLGDQVFDHGALSGAESASESRWTTRGCGP